MKFYLSQVSKNVFKLSTMVGENFEIYSCQVAKNTFKLSTMNCGENYEQQIFSKLLKLFRYSIIKVRNTKIRLNHVMLMRN